MSLTTEGRYKRLLEPVDLGELTLPQDVLTARATLRRLIAALNGLPTPVAPHVPRDAAVRAALASDDPVTVDVTGVLDHDREVAEIAQRRQVLTRAREIAESDLAGTLEDNADQIIIAHVRPTGEALWTEIVKQAKALDGIDPITVDAMLRAGDKARKAFLELDTLTGKYVRLRGAWSPLPEQQPVEHDVQGDHAEFAAGLCKIAGPNWRGNPMAPNRPKPPWPDDPRGRLIWLVRHGHTPWWPTAEQRDQAWMNSHREQYERVQNQQRLNAQTHGRWSQTG